MIIPTLKARAAEAMKARDGVTTSIVRLALGEMQTAEARSARPVTEEEAVAIVRKLVKSNEETLALTTDAPQKEILQKEIAILSAVLPQSMTPEEIALALAPVADAIRAAANDGQATGIAMKQLKSSGATAQGTDVSKAVKLLRG